MEIPYDQLGGIHLLTITLTDAVRYTANHGGNAFVCPPCLPLYDGTIMDNATTVVRVCAKSAHKARLGDYASQEAAKHGAAKFLCNAMEEVW
jgi:hypothetical protein